MTSNPPYAQMLDDSTGWRACATSSATNARGSFTASTSCAASRAWIKAPAAVAARRGQRADLRRVRADRGVRAVAVVRRTAATVLCRLARRARRRRRRRATRPRSAGFVPLAGTLSLKLNAATAFRAPTAEELYYPGLLRTRTCSPNARASETRRWSTPALWGGVSFGWFTTSGSNLIVSPPPALHSGERRPRIDCRPLAAVATPTVSRTCVATLDVTNLYRARRSRNRRATARTRAGLRGHVGVAIRRSRSASRFDGFRIAATHAGTARSGRSVSRPGVRESINRRRSPTSTHTSGIG